MNLILLVVAIFCSTPEEAREAALSRIITAEQKARLDCRGGAAYVQPQERIETDLFDGDRTYSIWRVNICATEGCSQVIENKYMVIPTGLEEGDYI